MFTRADLHIHSTASDGVYTSRELVLLAKGRGIDTISITDHNSTVSIDKAEEAGRMYGISIIPGVELSTRYNGESIHLLGYFRNRNYNNYTFKNILSLVKAHRAVEVRKMFKSFRGRQNLNNYLSTNEGIYILKAFGAAVVLAHPVRASSENLHGLLTMPFDGLEAKYCHSSEQAVRFFIKRSIESFSFYTAGSDFHTDRIRDCKHCLIGETYLNSVEIQSFLENSGALVLGGYRTGKHSIFYNGWESM